MAEQNLNSRLAAAPRESQMIDISSAIIYSKRQRRSLGSVAISSGPLAGDNLDWLGSLTMPMPMPGQVPRLTCFFLSLILPSVLIRSSGISQTSRLGQRSSVFLFITAVSSQLLSLHLIFWGWSQMFVMFPTPPQRFECLIGAKCYQCLVISTPARHL